MPPEMPWFRLYHAMINDPKVLQLSPENRWFYVATLCAASMQSERGTLPNLEEMALHFRVSRPKALRILGTLEAAGLIEKNHVTQRLVVHGWEARQRKSDSSTPRVRALRQRDKERECNVTRNGDCNVPVTPQSKNKSKKEKSPLPPCGGNGVGDDLEPFDPGPPTGPGPEIPAEHKPIVAQAVQRWGADGEAAAADLLRTFKPEIVRAACDAHFDRVKAHLHLGRLRAICRDMELGRWEMPRTDRAPGPSARPVPALVFTTAPADWRPRPTKAS